MAKQRNTYNNDRLMWLGAFAPGLRTPRPVSSSEKLSTVPNYPARKGDVEVVLRVSLQSLMTDPRTKFFVNDVKVTLPESPTWADLPQVVDGDRVTVWVYEEEELLPAVPNFDLSLFPSLSGQPSAFPVNISGTSYGYVNGLYPDAEGSVGNPVAEGTTPLTFGSFFQYKTTKLMSYDNTEMAQVVFTADPALGQTTEIAFWIEVVMCKITARHQAVQHDGTAGGNFLVDGYTTKQIYNGAVTSDTLDLLVAKSTYRNFVTVSGNQTLFPTQESQTYSSAGLSPPGSYVLSYTAPLMDPTLQLPTDTYPGKRTYFAALNLKLANEPLQILTGEYGGPIPDAIAPPGGLLAIPSYTGAGCILSQPLRFSPDYLPGGVGPYIYIQNLPIPEGYDPADTLYSEVVYYSEPKPSLTSSVVNPIGSLNYSWPPTYLPSPYDAVTDTYVGESNAGHGWDGGDTNVPTRVLGVSTILAPTYVLSQYVDAENPELARQTGRAVYIQLTTTVELSDAQYAALREAGVQSIGDFEAFIADNPDIGEIATTTEFDIDLNTPQMQDVLGTNQEDQEKADALFALLNDGFTPSEDFLAAAGNSVQSKLYPPSPSNMDKLKMAGKVVSGVNSLITLGKIIANIGVLQTPLGILMLINTGINIYNATQAAQGLANNQNPQYIPTINESIYNSLFRDPNPPRSNLPRTVPPFPRRIP